MFYALNTIKIMKNIILKIKRDKKLQWRLHLLQKEYVVVVGSYHGDH